MDSEGSPNQTPCPPGTFSEESGATSLDVCVAVSPGEYSPGGAQSGIPCPPGTYQPDPGQESCIDSDPGHYSEGSGSVQQEECLPGTYMPEFGAEMCSRAASGHFVAVSASTYQRACEPGTFQPKYGSVSCIPAIPGNFVDEYAQKSMKYCQPGSFQPSHGSTSCIIAPKNSFSFSLPFFIQRTLACQISPRFFNLAIIDSLRRDCVQAKIKNQPNKGKELSNYFFSRHPKSANSSNKCSGRTT